MFGGFMKNQIFLMTFIFVVSIILASQFEVNAQSCTQQFCTGLDANASGCSSDAVSLGNDIMNDEYGLIMGSLVLHYSPSCDTVWSSVNATYENSSMSASISARGSSYGVSGSGSSLVTPMIWVKGSTSGAYANGTAGATILTIFDCPPIPNLCTARYHSAGGEVIAP